MTRSPVTLQTLTRLTELADHIVPFAIRTAAALHLADHLSSGPKSLEALAVETHTDREALRRLLACLIPRGIFAQLDNGTIALTPLSELLTGAHPLSLRDAFPIVPAELRAWSRVDHSLRTGESAFRVANGQEYWEYMAANRDEGELVDRAVESANPLVVRMFDRRYEWDRLSCVVDVGGGTGTFLVRLLARHARLRGILFDLASVAPHAARVINAYELGVRCEIVTGSFFDGVPVGGDAYLLKTILHDWSDNQALAILRNVRDVIPARGRLLVIEPLIDCDNSFDIGKLLALNSFVLAGGQDRSLDQFDRLFRRAGFQRQRVIRTTNVLALIEATPVSGDSERDVHHEH